MELSFIYNHKEILTYIEDTDIYPKKNTYIDIKNKKYLIYDFSISSQKILYLLK